MTDPVHNVNILLFLMLCGVLYMLYYILTYDNRDHG